MARNALFIMVLFLTGCMSTYVKLDVTATDNINLNQFNEPLPVVLKVYQLTDIQAFKNSTFEQLWNQTNQFWLTLWSRWKSAP